jgi:hypothetical protein
MKEVRMLYRDYKALYSGYKAVSGSYRKSDRTIIVRVPDKVEYTLPELERWLEIPINQNNVKWFADNVLIKLPYRSQYSRWELWCSTKLVKDDGWRVLLRCKESFTFKIRKNGAEMEIGAVDLADVFGVSLADQEEPEIHVPEKLEPVPCEALEELIDEY